MNTELVCTLATFCQLLFNIYVCIAQNIHLLNVMCLCLTFFCVALPILNRFLSSLLTVELHLLLATLSIFRRFPFPLSFYGIHGTRTILYSFSFFFASIQSNICVGNDFHQFYVRTDFNWKQTDWHKQTARARKKPSRNLIISMLYRMHCI